MENHSLWIMGMASISTRRVCWGNSRQSCSRQSLPQELNSISWTGSRSDRGHCLEVRVVSGVLVDNACQVVCPHDVALRLVSCTHGLLAHVVVAPGHQLVQPWGMVAIQGARQQPSNDPSQHLCRNTPGLRFNQVVPCQWVHCKLEWT